MKVFIPTTCTYIPAADAEAAVPLQNQSGVTVSEAPVAEEPIDLDTALDQLDAELQKLDLLSARQREFPSAIANIDGKLKELEAQDLDTLQALEARSAQVLGARGADEFAPQRAGGSKKSQGRT
jgi:hypothetical protein